MKTKIPILQPVLTLLQKISTGKIVTMFLVLLMVSNWFINGKPYGLSQLIEITGGTSIPDMEMTGYSPERLYDILDAQGEAGRAFYRHTIMPQDIFFPFFYACLYATGVTYLARKLFPTRPGLQNLALLGLFAGLMDWAENVCLFIILLNYPQRLDGLALLATTFTVIKGALIIFHMVVMVGGFSWLWIKFLRKTLSHDHHNH